MTGLPKLPGNTFTDPSKQRFNLNHTLEYQGGKRIAKSVESAVIGDDDMDNSGLLNKDISDLGGYNPLLTYGRPKGSKHTKLWLPDYVTYDKKVLHFKGYFSQSVHESPDEHYRIRPVEIYYYLEDDTISVREPKVENTGMPQGNLLKRSKLVKDDLGNFWHWKDFNLAINLIFYGKVFRITDCDPFTKEFMSSEGIELNSPEEIPVDPYTTGRKAWDNLIRNPQHRDWKPKDTLGQFLENDRKILRFYGIWDDRDEMFGDQRPVIVQYYLVDDTMELREVHTRNDGRVPFPLLLKKSRVPKFPEDHVSLNFMSCILELSEQECSEWYSPKDLVIGNTIFVYGKKILLYDCDEFTKQWYQDNYGITDFTPLDVQTKERTALKVDLPPYNGFGSVEDSLQSCLSLHPEPPKKDYVKLMSYQNMALRYAAVLESRHAEDSSRRFTISYRLNDDTIQIYEPSAKNSGRPGGRFLEPTKVAKPGHSPDHPVYYRPWDFYPGALVEIFRHRFRIIDCDNFVISYVEDNKDKFPPELVDKLRAHKAAKAPDNNVSSVQDGPNEDLEEYCVHPS